MIYDDYSLDNLAVTVRTTCAHLRDYATEFDSLAVQGMSGVLVGSPVALRLRKPLVIVRKENDNRHASEDIINYGRVGAAWLFLDDFIDSGATQRRVYDALLLYTGTNYPRWAGSYCYSEDELTLTTAETTLPPYVRGRGAEPPWPVPDVTATSAAIAEFLASLRPRAGTAGLRGVRCACPDCSPSRYSTPSAYRPESFISKSGV
jgi:hypothetical protein